MSSRSELVWGERFALAFRSLEHFAWNAYTKCGLCRALVDFVHVEHAQRTRHTYSTAPCTREVELATRTRYVYSLLPSFYDTHTGYAKRHQFHLSCVSRSACLHCYYYYYYSTTTTESSTVRNMRYCVVERLKGTDAKRMGEKKEKEKCFGKRKEKQLI